MKVIYKENDYYKFAYVYNYNFDTVKEFEQDGWSLSGTFYNFLTFKKIK